ncbi:MAG TPA: diaminopimelate decarboxylase [Candidatus Baltobacteraceae bacterium]|nr:diaminopimelate decarboxylase [Candidatus Baltobacteraceae bacterium]
MLISGVDVRDLAHSYGTPLVAINVDSVDASIATLHVACDRYGVEIAYAAKAFFCVEFARHLGAHPGLGVDVCSLGELTVAERAGFPVARITLHGAGKSEPEVRAAVEGRVGRIVVDAVDELAQLASFGRPANVMLRLNTGIDAQTHAFLRTGGSDTKFGLAVHDEPAAAEILLANPQLRFIGVHAHIGSQIYDSAPYVANSHALIEAAARFAAHGLRAERIIVGGGFGTPTHPDDEDDPLDIGATIADIARCVRDCAGDLGLAPPRLGIEPGRAIVASAGTTIYRVLAVKRQSHRTFVVVDGGIFENPRPALYGARYRVVAVEPSTAAAETMTVCGRTCENDELATAMLPGDLQPGALLAMQTTGAYTFSMAGNYNRLPRPAVAAVQAGAHRRWVRREAVDDVLRNDDG